MPDTTALLATDAERVRALGAALDRIAAGHHDTRIDDSLGDAEWDELRDAVNRVGAHLARTVEEHHSRSMELAMGVSECFQVLEDIRQGKHESRAGEATLTSSEYVIAQFGRLLNLTLDELRDQLETVERQRFAIHELSTPILQIWDDVLALPIIGIVDTRRSVDIMERLLAEVVARQARFVLLDITGVEVVDTRTADYLVKVVKAAELLGTKCILTGVRPAVAQTLVEIGVDLSGIRTVQDLQAGLGECLRLRSAAGRTGRVSRARAPRGGE